METSQKRERILGVLTEIEQELRAHPEEISDHVFNTLEAICSLAYGWKTSGQKGGWSKQFSYFSPDETDIVESQFSQIGGGKEEDAEFEKEYGTFKNLVKGIYEQWNEITNSLGIVGTNTLQSLISKESGEQTIAGQEKKPLLETIQTEKPAQKVVSQAVFSFFSVLLESIRIWVAYSAIDSGTYRVLLSFSQLMLDAVRGNTRQALLSSLGLFGKNGYYLSILSRLLVNLISTISPNLALQMEFDMYKNLKSLTSAILLWFYYTFAPQNLKYTVNTIFKEIQEIAKKNEVSLTKIEDKIRSVASSESIQIPEVPLEHIPSYDDLMKLGELLADPEIACLPAFQKLIAPLRSIFSLRLVLDLFNIPTGQIEFQDLCSTRRNQTRKQTPVKQKGGKRKHKTRRAFT